MSATRSLSDLELPVDEEQRHAMPLDTECEADRDARIVAASIAAHRAGRAAAALESHIHTLELLEDPVVILSGPQDEEQMAYHKRNYEDAVDAIRLHLSREFLQDPIRIRPEPADRNLASETEDNEKLIEHHQRRCNEEVAAVRSKFACHRERARCAMYAELDRHEKFCRRSSEWEALKIGTIEKRRAELAWTCPNDGQAYPFTFKGWRYHRTYLGETWLSENWTWMGYWVGYYIKSGKPPHDDEVSDKIREVLKQ